MAELTIDPASIRKALDDFVSSYQAERPPPPRKWAMSPRPVTALHT